MVIKCGLDAGRIYRHLLKLTKYGEEVCGVESSENVTCDEAPHAGEYKLSEIYYGLIHRFGEIPDQATEADLMDETASIAQSESISESLNKALDAIDYSEGSVASERLTLSSEANRNREESRKWPVILEQFKGLLFYNYSNEDFEFYWRQPGSFPIERVTCDHVLTPHMKGVILECTVQHRSKEPECYYNTKPTTNERITPELIRDIDMTIPEDSNLDISESLDLMPYLMDYQRYRMSWEYWFSARLILKIDVMKELNRNLEKEYPNHKVCAKESRYFDIINDRDIYWWQCPSLFSDELRNEIVTFLYSRKTKDDVLFLSVFNEDDKSYVHLFEPLLHAFDKVVCERVNECHPRGRGVFKCSMKRRDLKGCNSCCGYESKGCNAIYEGEEKMRKSSFGSFNSSEEVSEDSSVHLVDEATILAEESTNFVTGVIGENGDLVALDLSELQTDSNSESSSDVNLVFLSQNSEGSGENSFLERSGILSTSDNETPYELSEHELKLSNDNTFVLKAAPSIAEFEPAYEIDFADGLW